MKQNIIKSLLILSIALTTSCVSTTFFTIDVMEPARINFAENVVNVAIVDNAGATLIASTGTNYSANKIVASFGKDVFTKSLAQFLGEEQYFNDVIYYPQVIRSDTNFTAERELTSSQIQAIAKEVDADAVISINTIDFEILKAQTGYDNPLYNNQFMLLSTQVNLKLTLRIYDSNARSIAPIILAEDSIFWLGDKGELTHDIRFIEQLALEMSEGMAQQLAPHWSQQQRWYYSNGTKLMKQAKKQAKDNNWNGAARIWGTAFEAATKETDKAKIASNIALANENLGDITNAITWIRIASNLLENHQDSEQFAYMEWYKIALLKRERDNPKVLEQIGGTTEEFE